METMPQLFAPGHAENILASLEPGQRWLFLLHFCHGFSLDESAYILKQPQARLTSSLARIMETFGEHFQSCQQCSFYAGEQANLPASLWMTFRPVENFLTLNEAQSQLFLAEVRRHVLAGRKQARLPNQLREVLWFLLSPLAWSRLAGCPLVYGLKIWSGYP